MLLLALLGVLALSLPATGSAVVYIPGQSSGQLPDYYASVHVAPTAAQRAAARSMKATVTWSEYGTPGTIFNRTGYVATGVKGASAGVAARNWLRSNRRLFGIPSVSNLKLVTAAPLRGTRTDHAVVLRQTFGKTLADGEVAIDIVGSAKAGWKITYVSSSISRGSATMSGTFKLSPLSAWTAAAGFAGHRISRGQVTAFGRTSNGSVDVIATGFMGDQAVHPVAWQGANGAVRAYKATVQKTTDGAQSDYDVVVDAATGKLLSRQNLVFNAVDDPTWLSPRLAASYNDMNAYPWNYPTTDNRALFCWTAGVGCAELVPTSPAREQVIASDNVATNTYPGGVASKQPWDAQATVTGFTGTANSTLGNNVDDARVWSGGHTFGQAPPAPPNDVGFRATSATRDYQPAFTDAWYTSGCNPNNVLTSVNPAGNDIEASTVSLFVGHNIMHDWAYYLGFDEGHWNAQQYNNGVTANDPTPPPGGPTIAAPLGNDGLIGNAEDGAATGSRDNANMSTGADGAHPTTNQFLWQPLAGSFYAPCVDGAYDFSVFGHEFGHLIENRLIGKGVGARTGNAAGSMGEGFADFDALAAFNELHLPIPPGAHKYTEGAYATGNGYNGIRNFLAGEPMGGEFPAPSQNPDTDPLNYGDFGYDITGPEVHSDGEIWVAVNIDLRDLFLLRYPSPGAAMDIACARGQHLPATCPGDRKWIQDYYDSMVIMPRATTMQQARDAMVAADLGRSTANPAWGDNRDIIWEGYALRGFGANAFTASNADTDPVPDFSSPLANNATLNFFADSKEGSAVPVNAKIYVGDYSARATQIADTDPATVNTGATTINLDNTAQFAPNGAGSLSGGTAAANARWGYYNFVAVAPGYGILRFKVKNLKAGEVRNITLHFPTNYASATQGATITTDAPATGTNLTPGNLIDDNEATTNTQSCTPTATCLVPVNGRWVVIKLGNAGTGISINRLGVSAMYSSRFVGLRSFDAYSCRAGKSDANPNCDGSIDAGWTKIITGPVDSFPGANPRPGVQDESLRYFDASPQPIATHLKFVVTNNQCTGQPSFQGDQDLDPTNNSECRTGSRRSEVHTAEIEVFKTLPTVDGTLVSAG